MPADSRFGEGERVPSLRVGGKASRLGALIGMAFEVRTGVT